MMYPLVLDLADDGIPVTVTCRVLGFSTQAFHNGVNHLCRSVIGTMRT